MNNNTFKGLSDLSKGIKEKIDLIDKGKYGLVDLESTLQELNELQERLIVLKYKAIEQLAQENSEVKKEDIKQINKVSEQEGLAKETAESNSNQMTIMDGIKDVAKEITIEKSSDEQISLVEQMMDEEESLAEKMENSAVEDLKSVISINQRFSFIKELFGDDSDSFDQSIDLIEQSSSMKEANVIIENLRSERSWVGENKMVVEFEELIKRRFSA